MQFSVGNASNATAEIAAADALGASIRLMTVGRVVKEDTEPSGQQHMTPQDELPLVQQSWSRASARSVGGPWGSNFSAVCAYCSEAASCAYMQVADVVVLAVPLGWFFGRDVQKERGYPVGLVSANWGATTIETWMSPAGLSACTGQKGYNHAYNPAPPNAAQCKHLGEPCTWTGYSSTECCGGRCFYYAKPPLWPAGGYCDEKSPSNSNSELFDNMINPLLKMTIYGAIWCTCLAACSVHSRLLSVAPSHSTSLCPNLDPPTDQGESDVGNEEPTDDDLASKNCKAPTLCFALTV